MPKLMIEYHDDAERLALEQAIAYVTHLRQTALTAAHGTVLAVCEQLALKDGRALLRSTLAAALECRVATAEQKGGPLDCVPKRTPDAPKADTHAPS